MESKILDNEEDNTWVNIAITQSRYLSSLENPYEIICNSSFWISFHFTYCALLKVGEIVRIESLPESEKRRYWEMSKKYSPNVNDKQRTKFVCKSMYAYDLITG